MSFITLHNYHLVILQSLDEIEKLYVDENLSQLDRVCLLLGSTFDVQKIWAIEQIIPLLKIQGSDVLVQKVLPKLYVSHL